VSRRPWNVNVQAERGLYKDRSDTELRCPERWDPKWFSVSYCQIQNWISCVL